MKEFEDYAREWQATKRNKVSLAQRKNIRCYLNHILRYLGAIPIADIKARDVDRMLDTLTACNPNTGRPMSHQMLANIRSTTSCVFEYAIDCEAVNRNPARNRSISRYAPKETRRALTLTEQRLIVSVPHRARLGALIMMLAGLRRGELIPLAWEDIDLYDLKIRVTKSVELRGNQFIVKQGTKTSWGRVVDIPVSLGVELEAAKEVSESRLVFPRENGSMHSAMSWKRMWIGYIAALENAPGADKTGIGEITAHYLRHTYATLLYVSGVDVLTASRLLGHANVKTTLSIYTHLDELMLRKSVDRLDNYIEGSFFSEGGP